MHNDENNQGNNPESVSGCRVSCEVAHSCGTLSFEGGGHHRVVVDFQIGHIDLFSVWGVKLNHKFGRTDPSDGGGVRCPVQVLTSAFDAW